MLYAPTGRGHDALMTVVCPSVCLPRPDPMSRTEGRSKLEIGNKEAHDMVTRDPI